MSKRKFTLDNIENFLLEFGFAWVNRMIYNPNTNKYKELKNNIFDGKAKFISLKNEINKQRVLMLVEIDDEHFVMSADKYKIEASEAWKEFLLENENKKTI